MRAFTRLVRPWPDGTPTRRVACGHLPTHLKLAETCHPSSYASRNLRQIDQSATPAVLSFPLSFEPEGFALGMSSHWHGCRIEPNLDQGGATGAADAAGPGSTLRRPPGPPRPAQCSTVSGWRVVVGSVLRVSPRMPSCAFSPRQYFAPIP